MASDPRSASLLTQPISTSTTEAFGFGPSSQRPTNPRRGFLYYDTTLQKEIVYTGPAPARGWQIIGVQPAAMVGFGTTAQRPVNPPPGYIFYDSTLAAQFTWIGTAWVRTSPTISASMTGTGTTSQRPTSPAQGFLYFDTTLQREIVWNGTGWTVIGPLTPTTPDTPGNPPVITSASSAAGVVGTPFSYQITATNTPTSYSTADAGALAAIGLTLSTTTGILSGTPTGTFGATVTLTATNGAGSGNLSFYLAVAVSGSGIPGVVSGSADGVVGTAFSYQITATNFPSSYSSPQSASLAAVGLTLNTGTGTITGTPTGTFSSTITISATNAQGTGSGSLTLDITAAAVTDGRFTSVSADMTVFTAYPAILGAMVPDSTSSILTFTLVMASGGQFPPGLFWDIIDLSGTVLESGSAPEGETILTNTRAIASLGGYTVVISSSSASANVIATLTISSGTQFSNGSARAFVQGPMFGASPIRLTLSGITATSRIVEASLKQVLADGTLGTIPDAFYWSFNGDTTSNPKTDLPSGLTSLVLIASTSQANSADAILQAAG